jgi:divalent metal cation (Fe/Co/Zn/Cd) transporter
VGLILIIASAIMMTILYVKKMAIVEKTGSRALRAEAKETLVCDFQDLTVFVGLGANFFFGWWWADPAAALGLIPFLIKEGWKGLWVRRTTTKNIRRDAVWQARAALFQRRDHGAVRAGGSRRAEVKMLSGAVPSVETMGIIGALVLLGNGVCFLLLFRHRSDDVNMRSMWLCSRNDIIANASVLVAAAGVKVFAASWPDILVGAAIAALFLRSAFTVLRESFGQLRVLRSQSTPVG